MATKEYFNVLMKAENFTNIKSNVKILEIKLCMEKFCDGFSFRSLSQHVRNFSFSRWHEGKLRRAREKLEKNEKTIYKSLLQIFFFRTLVLLIKFIYKIFSVRRGKVERGIFISRNSKYLNSRAIATTTILLCGYMRQNQWISFYRQ